jgi:hypothetical protein
MTDKHEISSENSADSAGLSECKKEVDAAYEVLGKEQAEYDKHILTRRLHF